MVDGLTKVYGEHRAVDDVTFSVEPGRVTGFLGPNGAGKSTTLRMLCALTRPTSGSALLLGRRYEDIPNPGRTVGVLLDASAQHPGRTGRESLTLSALAMGLDRRRVEEMLELVGLTPAEARRRVGAYSLGMRQRLGIANALLGSPRILLLDEPANGLDPAGIRWMRTLLSDFTSAGGAALLSSHLLREVEVIADDLVVIGRGRIVATGSKEELLATAGTVVRSDDDRALEQALRAQGLEPVPSARGGMVVEAQPVEVGRVAAAHRIPLSELRPSESGGLEERFLELTAADAREGVS
ncbi:ABC transporter [Ornithinimicrobium pekingense]|uniref:ABC transporter n=1 Tax=Ornithinimicrobium pekingense TaxID=384677 RepID=A0ABQ2F5D7_9MICO|nr:ABC transporter [Ornithinimicrobium pekingense]